MTTTTTKQETYKCEKHVVDESTWVEVLTGETQYGPMRSIKLCARRQRVVRGWSGEMVSDEEVTQVVNLPSESTRENIESLGMLILVLKRLKNELEGELAS